MAEYIRREDIFNVISIGRIEHQECNHIFDGMETEIKRIPSADVMPREDYERVCITLNKIAEVLRDG